MAKIVAQNACFCQKCIVWRDPPGFKLSVMASTWDARTNDQQGDQS
jgi:hypothetical protein